MAIVEALKTSGKGARRKLRVLNPVTLESVGEFEAATAKDVAMAVATAREAQVSWAAKSYDQRGEYMQRALKVLLDRQDQFMDQVIAETGRSRLETLFMEIFPTADSLNFYSKRAKKILADKPMPMHLLRMKKAKITYKPLGVIGIITPWNGPFVLSLNPTVQALMAGNAVILKPSEVTPFSGQLVEKLFQEAGLPDGVLQVLLGDGATGAALVNGGVDKISFTGSVATGRKVGEACGRNLVRCTLELGGKDPMLVCADADIERAAGGAVFGCFMNNGQYCSSTERIYVVEEVADDFTARVVAKVQELRVGKEGEFDLGPFIFDKQMEKVKDQIADAVAKGAKVLTGGKNIEALGKYFFEPTVLADVTHDMKIMTEETFGPVLPIMRVRDEAEGIRLANDTEYGLGGNVWSKDKDRAEVLARQIDAGSVTINDASLTYGALELPFGGAKSSGLGVVNGESGLKGYCREVPIVADRFGPKAESIWYPYDQKTFDGMKKAIKVIWGTPLRMLMR